eukprot:gb/GFBE01054668.1/.p1 GENE.gb/GFBE01054668.1/~~gb/GFBE01054668.1/.p1  ORF type:complete len:345 (+),score=45.64 gb/GFBE01054668.1/:1-1035(+)
MRLRAARRVLVATVAVGAAAIAWVRRGDGFCASCGSRSSRLRASLTLAARGGDSEVRAPPEPRARGPRTERDVANDVVFGVVAVDLLYNHDRLDVEVGQAFRRSVFDPALKRLRFYSDCNTSEARSPAKSWRLQDRTLERQFSLSCFYTDVAVEQLQIVRAQDPLRPMMQLTSRDILTQVGVRATDDPVSSALIAWTAHNVRVGDGPGAVWTSSRGRPWGYAVGKPEVSEWLLPVFVEHDRSSHAERMALVALGDLVKSAGGKLHPDSPVHGAAAVYASHTPCISCMAVFCQFKRRLPGVKLYVCFDKWGETNRWIAEERDSAAQDVDEESDVGDQGDEPDEAD